jgi:hypothetical protein
MRTTSKELDRLARNFRKAMAIEAKNRMKCKKHKKGNKVLSERCPWVRYKDLPKELKNKPIGKIFKNKDGFDTKITVFHWCNECEHHVGSLKKCQSCGNKDLIKVYDWHTCRYYANSCPVNRWGCSIHYRTVSCPPTCTCDRCY